MATCARGGVRVAPTPAVAGLLTVIILGFVASGMISVNRVNRSAPPTSAPAAGSVLPLAFEENRGQADWSVRYIAHAGPSTMLFAAQEVVLVPTGGAVVHMRFDGAAPQPTLTALTLLPGVTNHLIGPDPRAWLRRIPTFGAVRYDGVYPGVSVAFHGDAAQFPEYDFTVAPGVDPRVINLTFGGSDGIVVDPRGDLVISVSRTEIRQRAPHLYQEAGAGRRTVSGRFVLRPAGGVGFEVGAYDHALPLIIDPTLVWSGVLGGRASRPAAADGAGQDPRSQIGGAPGGSNPNGSADPTEKGGSSGTAIAVDSEGNAYVTGGTGADDFPVKGPFQLYGYGFQDAFVAKLDTRGALVYSTYLGGSAVDAGRGIAVDGAGEAYVSGVTRSANFPTTPNAFQKKWVNRSGCSDTHCYHGFMTKLNADGSDLLYSTYLEGTTTEGEGVDVASAIALDPAGHAYVAGVAGSPSFPTTAVTGCHGSVYVAELDTAGSGPKSLVYSLCLGGRGHDVAHGIAVDGSGSAFVAGTALSDDFPTTAGARQRTMTGLPSNAFVTKLAPGGGGLAYSTLLGAGEDVATAIAVGPDGGAYVTGSTNSDAFPVSPSAPQRKRGGGRDAFVARFNPAGNDLVYSTFLGGAGNDEALGIALDAGGAAHVVGHTLSDDFPMRRPLQATRGGGSSAFVTVVDPAGGLISSSYLGSSLQGGGETSAAGIAVDASRNEYLTGATSSTNFPVTPGAFQSTGGGGDAFVTKLGPGGPALASIRTIEPTTAPPAGGTIVVLSGTGFTGTTAVFFGSARAPSVRLFPDGRISVDVPPHAPGRVDVIVANAAGYSSRTVPDRFLFDVLQELRAGAEGFPETPYTPDPGYLPGLFTPGPGYAGIVPPLGGAAAATSSSKLPYVAVVAGAALVAGVALLIKRRRVRAEA